MIIHKKSNIIFGLSERNDGQMILREDREGIKNRNKYFSNLGIDVDTIVSAGLVHGGTVSFVSDKERRKIIKGSDGLITDTKKICLAVTVSDCLPIFIYDEKREVVGIAHAGWRGVVGDITGELVKKFKEHCSSDLESLRVFVGSHIQKCHFEVKEDILESFSEHSELVKRERGKYFVDLGGIVKKQFIFSGLKGGNIKISPECTYCNEKYFSFRRESPEKVVSQIAYIVLD